MDWERTRIDTLARKRDLDARDLSGRVTTADIDLDDLARWQRQKARRLRKKRAKARKQGQAARRPQQPKGGTVASTGSRGIGRPDPGHAERSDGRRYILRKKGEHSRPAISDTPRST